LHSRVTTGLALALAAASATAACHPASQDATTSEEALETGSLAGTFWRSDDASSALVWLRLDSGASPDTLRYRAERRAPAIVESGDAKVTATGLTLVRRNVRESFSMTRTPSALTLKAGAISMTLKKAAVDDRLATPAPAPKAPVRGAVRARDGKIYAVLKPSPLNAPSPFAAYDPATKKWQDLGVIPIYVDDVAITAGSDGRVYLVGGSDDPNSVTGASAEVVAYEPEWSTWLRLPPLPEARAAHAVGTCPDGRIVVAGGWHFNGLSAGPTYLRRTDVYDPRTGETSKGPELTEPALMRPTMTSTATGVVLLGGITEPASPYPAVYRSARSFDCRTNEWRKLPDMPGPRCEATAITDERGRIFVFGGRAQQLNNPSATDVFVFDPSTSAWTTAPSAIETRAPNVVVGPGGAFWALRSTETLAFDPWKVGAP